MTNATLSRSAATVPAAHRRSHWLDRRLILTALLAAGIASSFWLTSRFPALDEKAIMGGDARPAELGFETVIQVQDDDPLILGTLYTTLNWLQSNRKGMTFGVLFGAALLVLLSLLRTRRFRNPLANTFLGMTLGAPLGVCVNCAAPIAQGIYSAGGSVQTTLAAMVSSPTLNVIVLSMLFALFPVYIVAIKLGLTLGFIVVGIPLLCRLLRVTDEQLRPAGARALAATCLLPDAQDEEQVGDWFPTLWWLVRSYGKSLWYIVKTTVPLMLLAGFLGALLITALPWDSLAHIIPERGRLSGLFSMGLVALIGTFLPVPISFDVIVPATLLAAGMPVRHVVTLLFTLGIFSIYAFFIVWNVLPKRMAVGMFAAVTALGVVGGVGAHGLEKVERRREVALVTGLLERGPSDGPTILRTQREQVGREARTLLPELRREALLFTPVSVDGTGSLSLSAVPFAAATAPRAAPFQRHEGELGLDEPYAFSVLNFTTLTRFRAIAAGDVHNDGWPDVLLTADSGLSLYANQHGESFVLQLIDAPELRSLFVVNAALVDLDDDGWLDIFFSAYRRGNYVLYNDSGRFTSSRLRPVPNLEGAVMAAAAAFGDIDRDRDLDIALGNFTVGFLAGGRIGMATSRSALLRQQDSGYRIEPLHGIVGEALSALLSDFNGDGYLDLIIGNDFDPQDNYYVGTPAGTLRALTRDDSIIPHTGKSTMSLATADVNNDLRTEIYVGQISGRAGGTGLEVRRVSRDLCAEMIQAQHRHSCERFMAVHPELVRLRFANDIVGCRSMQPAEFRDDCVAALLLVSAIPRMENPRLCDRFPQSWETFAFICRRRFAEHARPDSTEQAHALRDLTGTNVFLMPTDRGRYVDRAKEFGIAVTGWTWNAKFADLDNDEWQDLYVVNGEFSVPTRESNLFFRNEGGTTFVERTAEYGLRSFLPTSSYVYIDFDNDGDLDIIAVPAVGPVLMYTNHAATDRAIAFELRDHRGNRFGLGSKVFIHYGPRMSRHQMREIQAGGGFVSFDPPMAHFGLGNFAQVDRVEVQWSTGERTELIGPFPVGARYVITRHR